ncbi:MAG TPA: glycosyltransferase N-terminal domain-containing protein, partial [Planctomycetota bacterium]|nr:glycosyltransferase N-terminal domain-containing protein [Planctomycetota bacterium]
MRGFLIDSLYFLLAVTLGPPYLLIRRLKGKPLGYLAERLGFGPRLPRPTGPRVWIHGVSVGEVLAARSLVSELRSVGVEVVLSSTTRTGIQTARATYKGVVVAPAPIDFGPSTRSFLRKVAPNAIILLELELWPRLLMLAEATSIPVVVANARVSESSLRGYTRLRRFLPSFPGSVAAFLVQDEVHRERLMSLGVPPSRVLPCGNLKFDNTLESGG